MNQKRLYEQYTDNLLDSVFQNARYTELNMFDGSGGGSPWKQQQDSGLYSVPIVHTKSPIQFDDDMEKGQQQPRSPIVARKSVPDKSSNSTAVVRKKVPQSQLVEIKPRDSNKKNRKKKKRIVKKIIYEQASDTEDDGDNNDDDDDDDDDEDDEEEEKVKSKAKDSNKFKLQNINRNNNNQTETKPPLVTRKSLRNTLLRRKKPVAKPEAQEIVSEKPNDEIPTAYVDDTPSFWRPRESRKKGWWKGNAGQSNNKQTEQGSLSNQQGEKKKPVSSIKSRRATRPMAFKTPKRKNNKVSGSNSNINNNSTSNYIATSQAAATPVMMAPQTPMMYAMPQMYPQQQQQLFPQQMFSQFSQPFPFAQPSPMYYHPQPTAAEEEEKNASNRKRSNATTTIYNPREASHDKCCIM